MIHNIFDFYLRIRLPSFAQNVQFCKDSCWCIITSCQSSVQSKDESCNKLARWLAPCSKVGFYIFCWKIQYVLKVIVSYRNGASGFCYVNDIAVAISELLKSFPRVLYVDLDVHHGNGVENLFCEDSRVMTLSFHLNEPGFFPCTGNVDDVGVGEGEFYSVNVPLKAGLSNKSLISIFDR